MADLHLRELERQACAGDPSAQVALLRERERVGERGGVWCRGCTNGWAAQMDLDLPAGRSVLMEDALKPVECPLCQGTGRAPLSEGIELAAYCGDEASRLVAGWRWCEGGCYVHCDGPCWHHPLGDNSLDNAIPDLFPLSEWLSGLSSWPGALERAAVAAGWAALEVFKVGDGDGCRCPGGRGSRLHRAPNCRPRQALEATEAWLACPCEEHRGACAKVTHVDLIGEPTGHDDWWRRACTEVWMPRQGWAQAAIQAAASLTDEPTVRAAICARLIPWALNR